MRRIGLGASVVWLVSALALGDVGLDHVASLVRTGDTAKALLAIDALPEDLAEDDAVEYLRGRLLLQAGRPCDAMDALPRASSTLPEAMQQDSVRRWARAAARCGRCEEARRLLLGAESSEVAITRADRAVAAECAAQMGELETAAEELDRLTRRKGAENRVELLSLLADVYDGLGRPDEARDAALAAWKASVSPHQQRLAESLLDRASPDLEDRLDRAGQLMSARRFERAAEELETIGAKGVAVDDELNARWHHLYGMALFRMRTRYLDAARVLHRSALLGGATEVEDAFHSARALSRADKDARAIASYRRFASKYPKSKRAPEARFLAAWLEIRLGRSIGERHMETLVRGKSQVYGRWRRSASWELGFRALETRRYSRAVRFLTEYSALATTAMDEARAHYWLGRAYRRGPKAVAEYRQAIATEPLHWYAVLASSRLKQQGIAPPGPFEDASSSSRIEGASVTPPLPSTFVAYRRLGLDREGIEWLGAHEQLLVADVSKAQRAPALARLYREAGAYREAMVAARRVSLLQSDPAACRWWWDAMYPMPWLEIVDAHRGDLPRALVYATMRQESVFQPDVISRAGAVGLMQVMPELASKLAGRPIARSALLDPATNIELGLREMAALAAELDHVYPLSIAAYNAGQHRVRRWLKESGRMELDRFVERIPFNETRNYVRRVTTHYARYAYLDDAASGWPELPRFVSP